MSDGTNSPLDRNLQRQILFGLRDLMPLGTYELVQDLGLSELDENILLTNLFYLAEHGLIEHGFKRQDYVGAAAEHIQMSPALITARGMDFLEQDGGLSAILGVVTVRLHDDTIRSLVEAKIVKSDLPEPEKRRFLDALKSLPGDAIKRLAMRLIDKGVDQIPFDELCQSISSGL